MGGETICATLEKILLPQKHSSAETRADVVPGTPLGYLTSNISSKFQMRMIFAGNN